MDTPSRDTGKGKKTPPAETPLKEDAASMKPSGKLLPGIRNTLEKTRFIKTLFPDNPTKENKTPLPRFLEGRAYRQREELLKKYSGKEVVILDLNHTIAYINKENNTPITLRPHLEEALKEITSHGRAVILWTNMPREDVERRFTAIHPRIAGYFDLILTSESYANPTHEERRKTGITDIVNQSEKFPDLFFGNKTLLYDNSTWPDRTAKKRGFSYIQAEPYTGWADDRSLLDLPEKIDTAFKSEKPTVHTLKSRAK